MYLGLPQVIFPCSRHDTSKCFRQTKGLRAQDLKGKPLCILYAMVSLQCMGVTIFVIEISLCSRVNDHVTKIYDAILEIPEVDEAAPTG